MQYRTFGNTGETVSVLGFGCMRFPTVHKNGKDTIDESEAIRMLRTGIDQGVNYIDTAYPYHGGESERLVGKALRDGYREKILLATKSPVWAIEKPEDFDRILDEQLNKLETDHIDFYLLHALDRDTWKNKVMQYGLLDKIREAKRDGRVRHIGFSFHDDFATFKEIVDGFEDCEFCQIQLNYVDVEHQAGLRGLAYAAERGLGVIVMEPLLGGRLADPPVQVKKALPNSRTPVEWALDFIWNRPEVGLLLSGMSTMKQVEQNLVYAQLAQAGMLDGGDLAVLDQARDIFETMALVPCTKCGYCMPCPFGLDIPSIYAAYNKTACGPMEEAKKMYSDLKVRADACKNCRKCEQICPQHIASGDIMPQIAQTFDT
jgi:predicted aldo/keto reductase-like oxidoreductase